MIPVSLPASRIYTDFSAFASLRAQARADSPAAAKEVATQMESLFLQMMLKSMREASLSGGLFDSDTSKMYRGMMDQQLALVFAGREPGLGLKQFILKQLQQFGNKDTAAETSISSGNMNKTNEQSLQPLSKTVVLPPVLRMHEALQTPVMNNTSLGISYTNAGAAIEHGSGQVANRTEFVRELLPFAQEAAQALQISAKVLVAQAALETGWGQFMPRLENGASSFNYFGIKANQSWKGRSTRSMTTEIENGRATKLAANFRVYPDRQAGFADYVSLLQTTPRYQEVVLSKRDGTQFIEGLQRAGYATDPDYTDKIRAILSSPALGTSFKNPAKEPIAEYRSTAAGSH